MGLIILDILMSQHVISFFFILLLGMPVAAFAQNADLMPAHSASEDNMLMIESGETHEPIRLTPDKSEIVRLDEKAGTVIIGNPAHLNIVAENADTLVLVPGEPGATHFYVLNENAQMIMARHVIVASPKQKYIRIRNTCGDLEECRSTQVYYCPDMCHEIAPMALDQESAPPQDTGGSSSGDGGAASETNTNRDFREE